MGKNLILSFEKLKQENKKQFNSQNKNDANNDLLNELHPVRWSGKKQPFNKSCFFIWKSI
ncbi:hypothetical protein SKUN_001702 [Spiroplasma kunkelii CR2-3x]|uniref:Uncharacterized protein n=1 Tax=Spiroplasma kunkelii CR2-3x TaxID=273035 RepID=A0A0K2JJD3_SPIKU|nr:hypothetical protein [Spiroplasma kunkelii]ALA98558.1 hypothetical protein SKUN_001702 [Spiroplasma kunkelii CR2-3x]